MMGIFEIGVTLAAALVWRRLAANPTWAVAVGLGAGHAGWHRGRAVPWPDNDAHVAYKVRYEFIVGRKGAVPVRRYYRPDLDALIVRPSTIRRGPVTLRPSLRSLRP